MLALSPCSSDALSVLALGAHPDDIEIGAGGTLLTLAAADRIARIHHVVLSGTSERAAEAAAGLAGITGASRPRDGTTRDAAGEGGVAAVLEVHDLPDGRFPQHWGRLKQLLEELFRRVDPDLILAPRVDDSHQDHRSLAQLVPTVWRDHLVLGYEIPKWDGDLAASDTYVALDAATLRDKVDLIVDSFPSQAARDWFDPEVFAGLARLRGVECRSRYAEAFTVRRSLLRF